LREQVVKLLQPERGGLFVDCTVGLGGHARALLAHGATRLIGLDRDPAAVAFARDALAEWKDRVVVVHADYRDLQAVLDRRDVGEVTGVLADLGVSSMQLDSEGRGFSFRRDEPLDMRMDTSRGETAADLLARVDERELADVIYRFGEERHSRRIARALVAARVHTPLSTTGQVAEIVRRAIAKKGWERIDPATRTFQALRIWVNRELDGLDVFIHAAAARLRATGRLAVISFHSLEDRVVKHTFRELASAADELPYLARQLPRATTPAFRVVTRRPVTAADEEVAANPRARSAKLRVLERVARAVA
jgi:16S rRNA (cytosine1402-N4)-methyltransferase